MDELEFQDKRIDLEAAEWVSKRIAGFSAKEQDDFFKWLSEDPRHGEWYSRHMRTWKKLDLLAQWKPEHSDKPNPDLLSFRRRINHFVTWFGIAASIMFGAIMLNNARLKTEHPTGQSIQNLVADSYQVHTFPDGSKVEMNDGAALKVKFNNRERRVDLVSSEAHFEVQHDPERPFVVYAKGVKLRAVGTAFNVKIANDEVELLVTEGVVEMVQTYNTTDNEMIPEEDAQYKKNIYAGEYSVASIDETINEPFKISQVNEVQISDMLSWKPRSLQFNEAKLEEVIKEFNLRNETQIVVCNEDLKETVVVASFHSADVNKLISLLEATMDVKAEQTEDNRILLFRK